MIKDIHKAFRNRQRARHEEKQKVRILLKKDGLILDIVEFYDKDMELASGNISATVINRIKDSIPKADAFALEIARKNDHGYD